MGMATRKISPLDYDAVFGSASSKTSQGVTSTSTYTPVLSVTITPLHSGRIIVHGHATFLHSTNNQGPDVKLTIGNTDIFGSNDVVTIPTANQVYHWSAVGPVGLGGQSGNPLPIGVPVTVAMNLRSTGGASVVFLNGTLWTEEF